MMAKLCEGLSIWSIPLVLMLIPLIAYMRGVQVYEVFVEGAAGGFRTAVRILPFLLAMMVAVGLLRDSGALDFLIGQLQPLLSFLGIPAELVPLALMRPLSGTGTLGLATELLSRFGPDSLCGRIASTVMGSTDTTFYILTVYFGAVQITKPRYSLIVGLLGDITAFGAAIYFCRLMFD